MLPREVQNIIKGYAASMELYERKRRMQLELRFVAQRWHRRQMVLAVRRVETFCLLN